MSRSITLFATRTFTPVVTIETISARLLEGLDPNFFSADDTSPHDIVTPSLIWTKNAGECLQLLEPQIQNRRLKGLAVRGADQIEVAVFNDADLPFAEIYLRWVVTARELEEIDPLLIGLHSANGKHARFRLQLFGSANLTDREVSDGLLDGRVSVRTIQTRKKILGLTKSIAKPSIKKSSKDRPATPVENQTVEKVDSLPRIDQLWNRGHPDMAQVSAPELTTDELMELAQKAGIAPEQVLNMLDGHFLKKLPEKTWIKTAEDLVKHFEGIRIKLINTLRKKLSPPPSEANEQDTHTA